MSDPQPPSTLLRESELAARLHLPGKILAELRDELLTETRHFEKKAAGAIWLTPAGVERIMEALKKSAGGPPDASPAGLDEAGEAAGPKTRLVLLYVAKIPAGNKGILIGSKKKDGAGPHINVRVKSNDLFTRFQAILAEPSGLSATHYYRGPLPKWRGQRVVSTAQLSAHNAPL